MNLGELKKSLSKFPADMDDCHVIFITLDESKKQNYNLLAAVGTFKDISKYNSVTLISDEVCEKMMAEGKIEMKKEL